MKKSYTVIWFDDEHQARKKIRESAHLKGIQLIGFSNATEGIKDLDQNIEAYDAALLDGIFYETQSEKGTPTEDAAMGKVAKTLLKLETRKKLPWFILSGQDSFTKVENRFAAAFKEGKVYDKLGGNKEYEDLWNNLIEEANKLPDVQLKHKYKKLLEVCSDDIIGADMFSRLFVLIKHIEDLEQLRNTEDMLIPIRKLIERMFSKLADKGVIPEKIIKNRGWINKSSLFLSGRHSDYEHLTEIIHPMVCENIHRLLNITQDGSHTEGELKLKADDYFKISKSDYLYRSCVYLLFDIFYWFKDFIIENNDAKLNMAKWKEVSSKKWVTGTITKIENHYGSFLPENSDKTLSIIPTMVVENDLNVNDKIQVITEPSPNGQKTFIKQVRLIK